MFNGVIKSFVLFILIFKIGAVSFGGAYSIWALTEQNFINGNAEIVAPLGGLLPPEKFREFLEINRLTPGPNINVVLLVGHYYLGLWGIVLSFVALLLPSALAIVGLYHLNKRIGLNEAFVWFKEGALAAVTGIFASFIIGMTDKVPREALWLTAVFLALAAFQFLLIHVRKTNIILVTIFGGSIFWGIGLLWEKIL